MGTPAYGFFFPAKQMANKSFFSKFSVQEAFRPAKPGKPGLFSR
jgi:hypothetical protein